MKLYRTAAAIGLVQGLRWLQHPMPAVSVLFREGFELYDLNATLGPAEAQAPRLAYTIHSSVLLFVQRALSCMI